MINFIYNALKQYSASCIMIVREIGQPFKVSSDGKTTFIEINESMNVGQVLELCGLDLDAVVNNIGEEIATKMCSLIHNDMGGLITGLDINHINSAEIEKLIYQQRDMMLDYIADDFVLSEKIKRGE